MMKFYISATGIKRLTISSSTVEDGGGGGGGSDNFGKVMKGKKGSPWRTYQKHLLVTILILGLFLPFFFLRIAFVVLESTSICSSSLGCIGLRIFGGNDASLLREELTRALLEATKTDGESEIDRGIKDSPFLPSTFEDLVKDVTSNGQDIKTFTFKAKAVIGKLENMVQSAKQREYINWHLAAHGIPKSFQCLSLMLAEEYAVNAAARSRLPPPEYASRLSDPSFNHVALLTDNVLAASVVISSAVKNSANAESMVFHVITDKKSYTAMHAWFAANNICSAVVEVKGLHQYDWSHEINISVKEMLEIHRLIWKHEYVKLKAEDSEYCEKDLEVLSPSFLSLLNHLRIYLPELFPDLDKIVYLDDDVVVQHDLSPLWEMNMNGKVVGAVVDSDCGRGCCPGRRFKDYFNFTNSVISVQLHDDHRCGWLYGMNVFDIQAWRKTNITKIYHHWLKLSLNSGFTLWHPGALPPALLAFEGHVLEIDSSWHMAGLGHRLPKVLMSRHRLESAAVIHFSGPAKPWLEIAAPEIRSLWYSHLNLSNEYISKCGIGG